MDNGGTLRFRRHLAICAVLLLIYEFHLSALHGHRGGVLLASADQLQQQPADKFLGTESYDTDDHEHLSYLERALEFLATRLPTIKLDYNLSGGRVLEHHSDQLDREVENYYNQVFPVNMTLEQLQLISIKASIRMAPMPLHTSWGYESPDELRVSSWPVKDDGRCAYHLDALGTRLDRLQQHQQVTQSLQHLSNPEQPTNRGHLPEGLAAAAAEEEEEAFSLIGAQQKGRGREMWSKATSGENYQAQLLYQSTDLHFLRYLDTFGRAQSEFLRGNTKWYGSHSGCLDTKLLAPDQQRIKFRYCMAAVKSVGWKQQQQQQHRSNGSSAISYNDNVDDIGGQKGVNRASFGVTTSDVNLGNFFIRLGICLPESCDSGSFHSSADNARQIEKLAKFNLMKPFNSDRYYLDSVYCPPDDRSPLRSLPMAGKLLIMASLVWVSLILAATTVHLNVEHLYRNSVKEIRSQQQGGPLGRQQAANSDVKLDRFWAAESNELLEESDILNLKHNWIRLSVYIWDKSKCLIDGIDLIACLSLYSNWLRYTRKLKLAAAAAWLRDADELKAGDEPIPLGGQKSLLQQIGCKSNSTNRKLVLADEKVETRGTKRRVDTSSLNALKVMALMWIIAGHCVFYLGSTIANGAILMLYLRQVTAFLLANGAIYITELFFVITGCLTAYLTFKYNTFELSQQPANRAEEPKRSGALWEGATTEPLMEHTNGGPQRKVYLHSKMFKIPFWLRVIINRYLRIVPTYLAVYSYVKLVSIYLGGSGQLWDYAVSPNSVRRQCANESWWPVLSLTTNYLAVYNHCIVGGWYLSVDMQFMIMAVPMLLVMAHCQRRPKEHEPMERASSVAFSEGQKERPHNSSFIGQATGASDDLRGLEANQPVLGNKHLERHLLDALELVPKTTTTTTRPTKRGSLEVLVDKRRVLAGYFIVFLGASLSAVAAIVYAILQASVDLTYVIKFVPHTVAVLTRNIDMYTNSVFRFRAFACGLIVGHLLYLYDLQLIRLPKFLQQHGAKVTTTLFTLGSLFMLLPVLYPKGKLILSHDTTAILMILSAMGVDLLLCTLIYFICIGKAPKLALFFLESPYWSLLSQPSLCAFLIHTEVIALLTSQLNPPPSFQYSLLVLVFSATLIITYLLALALYLTFEMPVSRLLEALMSGYLARCKSAPVYGTDNAGASEERKSQELRRREPHRM